MSYVDGFVLAVRLDRMDDYKRIAAAAGAIWMEHGAQSFVECVAEDVPYGKLTSFPRAVHAQEGEVVVLSWITYESRARRDSVMAAVMADPRITAMMADMPVDGARMIFGGFEVIVSL